MPQLFVFLVLKMVRCEVQHHDIQHNDIHLTVKCPSVWLERHAKRQNLTIMLSAVVLSANTLVAVELCVIMLGVSAL